MSKRSINELDIILLSNDFDMFIAWKHEFDGVKNVQIGRASCRERVLDRV